ncbi:MAG: amino acid carrier protein [Bacteroidota bacterium]
MSHRIKTFLDHTAYYFNGPLFITLLLGTGLFFTIYLRFPQFRYFRRAFRMILGKEPSTSQEGDTSIVQAIATSLASSIGAGCISGVCLAIHIGGPAAVFWMWVNTFLGMATRMAEVAASHRYREKSEDGTMVGGPMYFMKNSLGMPWLGKIFAFGALFTTLLAGTLPQVNSMTKMLEPWNINKTVAGVIIMLLVAVVVLGGIQRIGQVTERLVPFMTLVYFGLVIFILSFQYDQLLSSLSAMFLHPFRTAPMIGGFLGASLQTIVQQGINWGFFTNDAGSGSVAIIHSSSKEQYSGKEGIMSMVEPFLSNCVCTLTALVIVSTGSYQDKVETTFDRIDIIVLQGNYRAHPKRLHAYVSDQEKIPSFQGKLDVREGKIQNSEVTILHDACLAEEITLFTQGQHLFNGTLVIEGGKIRAPQHLHIRGKSTLSHAKLGRYTFGGAGNNPLGWLTKLLMVLCFLLFAFSTIVSYSYFGDRALIYLGGGRYLVIYRLLFVLFVFIGAVVEATIAWKSAVLSCAMMSLPNLISLLLRPSDIKETIETQAGPKGKYKN